MAIIETKPTMYDLADQFIALANEQAQQQGTESVGTAIRYAASRYNAFETTLAAEDLPAERDRFLVALTEDYRKMLVENLDLYIQQAEK